RIQRGGHHPGDPACIPENPDQLDRRGPDPLLEPPDQRMGRHQMMTSRTLRTRSRRASRGFSLIEALVAIVIFALMMMGTIPLFVKSTADVARNRNILHYNNGMQALMDELTTRNSINSTDTLVTINTHVYT